MEDQRVSTRAGPTIEVGRRGYATMPVGRWIGLQVGEGRDVFSRDGHARFSQVELPRSVHRCRTTPQPTRGRAKSPGGPPGSRVSRGAESFPRQLAGWTVRWSQACRWL